MGALLVYAGCALTAALCAVLLLRAYRRTRAPLLLWSGLCFALLAVNNALVVTDLVLLPDVDLGVLRNGTALAGMMLLLYGLIWKTD